MKNVVQIFASGLIFNAQGCYRTSLNLEFSVFFSGKGPRMVGPRQARRHLGHGTRQP